MKTKTINGHVYEVRNNSQYFITWCNVWYMVERVDGLRFCMTAKEIGLRDDVRVLGCVSTKPMEKQMAKYGIE